MFVLKIIFFLMQLAICIAIFGIIFFVLPEKFNAVCEDKFGHKIATKRNYLLSIVATLFFIGGYYWLTYSYHHNGDVSNGIILILFGTILAGYMLYDNIRKTNILYGATGTAAILSAFGIVGLLAGALIILFIIASIFSIFSGRSVIIYY